MRAAEHTQTPWCAQHWTRRPYTGDPRWKRISSVGTTCRRDKYTGTLAVPDTRQQQLLARRGPGPAGCGRRSRTMGSIGATHRSLAQHACEGNHGQGSSVICTTRSRCGARGRRRARALKDWASTTAMADGARLAHRWIKWVAPWADASVDPNGLAVQPQEQADLVAKVWHDLGRVGRTCP